jgi:hypothetical protein
MAIQKGQTRREARVVQSNRSKKPVMKHDDDSDEDDGEDTN